MNIQAAYRTPSNRELSQPKCPRCGFTLLMAEQSAFGPYGHIRHTWACDDCGHEFVTSVRVLARRTLSGIGP
jgi:predicted RNA-binding Zn-ribbon protein involved in translation (DUF1610 family)